MVGHSPRSLGVGVVLLCAVIASPLLLADPAVGVGETSGDVPLAEAGLDQRVLRGETVRLDASGSYDPDGSVVAHEWRLRTPSGRTIPPDDPRAVRTTFTATTVGRYEVSLTVTDEDGNTGTDTMYVVVEASGDGPTATAPDTSTTRSTTSGDPDASGTTRGPLAASGTTDSGCPTTGIVGGPGGSDCAAADSLLTQPWVGIEGQSVVQAGRSYTYTAVAGGLADDRTYEWDGDDSGRTHTLQFRSGGTYTIRVAVTDDRGRSATSRREVLVEPDRNEFPEVEIADPDSISAGQRTTLTVEASDPDGRVVSTEWSPGRRVQVPTDGSTRTVRVTVTDDDGASATDSIAITGNEMNETVVDTDTTDVTCYLTDVRQRDGRNPTSDRCIRENGNTVSQTIGPSRIESWRQNEKIDLHWRRTNESHLRSLEADDTSTDYGVAVDSPHDEADVYGHSDDPVRMWSVKRWTTVDNDESFTLKNRSVDDDLNGDGEVNAADWDRRYRTSEDRADVDPHADASAGFKRSIRGDVSHEQVLGAGSTRRATARTIEGAFAGTSIDAETRRDRVAAFSRRTSAGDLDDGSDESDGTERSDGAGRTDDSGYDGDSGADDGTTDGVKDVDTKDDSDDTDTDTADRSDGTSGEDTDAGTEEPSTHSPHGGRIVAHP